MKAHKGVKHVFSDVICFSEDQGFCHVCGCEHKVSDCCSVDLFIAGPSCKDVSRLKSQRVEHVGCYEDTTEDVGTSGYTYRHGFLGVARLCLAFYL